MSSDKTKSKSGSLELANKNLNLEIVARKQIQRALKERESLLQAIFDSREAGLLVVDNNGQITHKNSAFIKMWNIPSRLNNNTDDSELLTFVLSQLSDPDQFLSKVKKLYKSTESSQDILHFKDKRIFERNSQPLIVDKIITGRVWSFRDITEQKKMEKLQSVIYKISQATHSAKNLDELYESIHKLLSDVLDVTNFYIATYDEKEQMLSFPFFKDEEEESPESAQPFGDGLTEYVIKTGKPLLLNRKEEEEYTRAGKFKSTGAMSELWMGAPLIIDDKVIGVIAMNSYQDPNLYTEKDLNVLMYVADQIANAIKDKQSIADLEIEKTYLDELFTNSPEAVSLVDTDNTILHINRQFTSLFGYSEKEAVGKNLDELLVTPEHRKSAQEATKKVASGKQQYFETMRKKKDGTLISVSVLGSPINYKGDVLAVYAIYRDITERMQAKETLKNSEERLKILFESAPDAYYLNDLKGTFIDGNKAAIDLMGYTKEELIGKSFLKLKILSAKEILKASKLLLKNIQGKGTGPDEFILIRKDGNQVPVEISTHPVKIDDKTVVLGIARDITERQKAAERLRKREEKYHTLTDNIPLGIYRNAPGAKGKFLEVNKALIKMFGFKDREAMLTSSVSSLYASPSKREKVSDMLIAKKSIKNEELKFLRQDGITFDGSITARAIKNENGNVIYYDGIIEDITERLKLRTQLVGSEEQFRSLVNNSPDIILRVDLYGVITYVNKEYSNQKPEDVLGQTLYDLIPLEFKEIARSTIKRV
ncbi:MAG: PAS domain S-box protein, partial [Candidatus Neomarinimicrobiota bacterium]